ncbi:hypothetical protein D3C76_1630280 [compost metagenome]
MQRVDILGGNKHCGTRRAVTIVLTEMQSQTGTRDLHVQRHIFTETVLPIQRETEKIQIKLPGLFNRKDAKNGNGRG